MPDQADTQFIQDTFERALGEILARVVTSGRQACIALACSGGLDSMALLALARRSRHFGQARWVVLHVDHGLSPNARHWHDHVEAAAQSAGLAFHAVGLGLDLDGNIEEQARHARYASLGQMAKGAGADLVLTAHHRDDQVESVLLQLFRGAGVAGLCGMSDFQSEHPLLKQEGLALGRPLLTVSRSALEKLAAAWNIAHIDDESNLDTRYTRNALRHLVLPSLREQFKGVDERVERVARHMQDADQILRDVAREDLARVCDDRGPMIDRLRELSPARLRNAVRAWLVQSGLRMPSEAWLEEMFHQVFSDRLDADVIVSHPEAEIRRFQGRIYLNRCCSASQVAPSQVLFKWHGENRIAFPTFGGELFFIEAECGIDRNWLVAQTLSLHARRGGERLKLAFNRPTRSLKVHYQAMAIPPWQRMRQPLLSAGAQLLFVAGLGMHYQPGISDAKPGIKVEWINA